MVIEPKQDFCVAACFQSPVGEVRLPAFVGKVGFESQPCAFGSFTWLRGDQAGAGQDRGDGGDSGNLVVVSR